MPIIGHRHIFNCQRAIFVVWLARLQSPISSQQPWFINHLPLVASTPHSISYSGWFVKGFLEKNWDDLFFFGHPIFLSFWRILALLASLHPWSMVRPTILKSDAENGQCAIGYLRHKSQISMAWYARFLHQRYHHVCCICLSTFFGVFKNYLHNFRRKLQLSSGTMIEMFYIPHGNWRYPFTSLMSLICSMVLLPLNVTCSKLVQPSKAVAPMHVTVAGISTYDMLEHPLNADIPMDVMS